MEELDDTPKPNWRWPDHWEEEPKRAARIRQEVVEEQSDHLFDEWRDEQND